MKKYTIIDLFAGAGGLSYGFQQTGKFDIKVAVEHNKHAQETYKKNHPGVQLKSDITKISNKEYKDMRRLYKNIDIVIGGPPCQGFSNANRQKNELICGNNQLVNEYIRAIENLKPKAFVMENVKTISSNKHKFFCSEKKKSKVEKLGVKLTEATIAIAETTICVDDFIQFLQEQDSLLEFLMKKEYYIRINTLYRKSKTHERLKQYVSKSEKKIMKILDTWDDLYNNFWNPEFEEIIIKTKEVLYTYLKTGMKYSILKRNLKVIIETQKAMHKMQEIKEYDITLIGMTICKKDLCVIVNSYNVMEYVTKKFKALGYKLVSGILNAANYGVPQNRERFIMIGVKSKYLEHNVVNLPEPILNQKEHFYTIGDAIRDLSKYETSVNINAIPIKKRKSKNHNLLQKYLNTGDLVFNHVITATRDTALERFKQLKPGQNFHNLGKEMKTTYTDPTRTQNTIYLRLNYDIPSGTVLNVRKSMWVHPEEDRAISIREAARLQSFPDSFIFCGTKDAQYQQIGNAVPPLLARSIAEQLLKLLGDNLDEQLLNIIC